jgi:RNA polymerase sigma-70 factor (ECF subfamily)
MHPMIPEDLSGKTDNELVTLSLHDSTSYRLLIERYHPKLFRYVVRLARLPKEDAEDILQEVFIKAYVNLNDYDLNLKFSSWIYRIAHNETVSFLRRAAARPKAAYFDPEFEAEEERLKADIDLAAEADLRFRAGQIHEALTKIDPKYQTVLVLKYLEDKSYEEMSDILKKPPGTIATLLNRAKKKLKEVLSATRIND